MDETSDEKPDEMPAGLTLQRTTPPPFDEHSTPAGLRRAHQVAAGVWGRLVVESGSLGFVFEGQPDVVRRIGAEREQAIPPEVPHHVVLDGPVRFAVEFYR